MQCGLAWPGAWEHIVGCPAVRSLFTSHMHLVEGARLRLAAVLQSSCSERQVLIEGPLQELHCRRIQSALLSAAEVLLRVLDLRLAHWQPLFGETMRHTVEHARCTATRDEDVHKNLSPCLGYVF